VQFQEDDDACAQQHHSEHALQDKKTEKVCPAQKEIGEERLKDTPQQSQHEEYE
jgi:hypothetical protein